MAAPRRTPRLGQDPRLGDAVITRREEPHHTLEQVRQYVIKAAVVARTTDIPDEWREAAFLKAVDLLASKDIVREQLVSGATLLDGSQLRG